MPQQLGGGGQQPAAAATGSSSEVGSSSQVQGAPTGATGGSTTGEGGTAPSTGGGAGSATTAPTIPNELKDALKAITDYAISEHNKGKSDTKFTIENSALEKLHVNILIFVKSGSGRSAVSGQPTTIPDKVKEALKAITDHGDSRCSSIESDALEKLHTNTLVFVENYICIVEGTRKRSTGSGQSTAATGSSSEVGSSSQVQGAPTGATGGSTTGEGGTAPSTGGGAESTASTTPGGVLDGTSIGQTQQARVAAR